MKAIEKIDSFGIKELHARIKAVRPKFALETVYRWRKALADGQGISDANKRQLIDATIGSPHAISWSDFAPAMDVAA